MTKMTRSTLALEVKLRFSLKIARLNQPTGADNDWHNLGGLAVALRWVRPSPATCRSITTPLSTQKSSLQILHHTIQISHSCVVMDPSGHIYAAFT